MAPRIELYAFRYRDPSTGKWNKARYRAERHEIATRYAEWEIMGPPEIRDVDPKARYFTPHRAETRSGVGNLGPVIDIAGRKPGHSIAIAGVVS